MQKRELLKTILKEKKTGEIIPDVRANSVAAVSRQCGVGGQETWGWWRERPTGHAQRVSKKQQKKPVEEARGL